MWIQKSCATEKCWNSRENLFSICHHPASWLCERSLSSSACYRKNETLFNWKYTHLKVHHRLVELGVGGAGWMWWGNIRISIKAEKWDIRMQQQDEAALCFRKKKTTKVLRSLGFAHDFMLLLSLCSPQLFLGTFNSLPTSSKAKKFPHLTPVTQSSETWKTSSYEIKNFRVSFHEFASVYAAVCCMLRRCRREKCFIIRDSSFGWGCIW